MVNMLSNLLLFVAQRNGNYLDNAPWFSIII